jgi:DNA-binding transcriptional MerR regulator/methylmalonyl-CoA mutase cobalamin-binding subunit
MYTIKQAAARSGVGAPLIRAWERRYRVVTPARTRSGYRLYDDAGIEVLRTMRSLVDAGWTASEAARAIQAGEVAVERTAVAPPELRETGPSAELRRAQLIQRFVDAAESSSPVETEAALDEMLGSGSFETVVDDLILPAAVALGDSWAAGRLHVAAEHAASASIARRLAAAFQAAGVPGSPSVVVGLPPGARHELGALAFATALRRRGVGVLYLGADVTLDSWVAVVRQTRPKAAVVGVVSVADRDGATAVIEGLRATAVPIIAVGGSAAGPDFLPGAAVMRLPQPVVEAAAALEQALPRRRG